MNRRRLALAIMLLAAAASGCIKEPEPFDYTLFRQEEPRSILVVPVMNDSPEVGAEDYFLATITVPMAERGYYVFPVNMTRTLLADAGLSDPGLVRSADATRIAELFGADAILYVRILNWEARYIVLQTTVTVGFEYELRSGKTGATLWKADKVLHYTPQTTASGNLIADVIVMAIQAAVTKAAPNYMPLARQANWETLAGHDPQAGVDVYGANPLLFGPHHASFRTDGQDRAAAVAAAEAKALPSNPVGRRPGGTRH